MPTTQPGDRLVAALNPRTPEVTEAVKVHIARLASEISEVDLDAITDAVEAPEGIGTHDLAARAGISTRQVDYWTTKGWLYSTSSGQGSGHNRHYPADAVVKARVMGALVRLFTMDPGNASKVADEIVEAGAAVVGGYTITKRSIA